MTAGAQEFIRPLTFAALSGEKVITAMFSAENARPNIDSAVEHIAVAQSIDALRWRLLRPISLARFAQGIANDFLTTLYLATTAPVVIAPAMNVNMWNHPATQANLETLKKRGVKFVVEPGEGYLACGMTGVGASSRKTNSIVAATLAALGTSAQDLVTEKRFSSPQAPPVKRLIRCAISPIVPADAWVTPSRKPRCAGALACFC